MRKFLLCLLAVPVVSFAQTGGGGVGTMGGNKPDAVNKNVVSNTPEGFSLLKNYQGIEIFYKLEKFKETDKNDFYRINVVYQNVNPKDYYYAGLPGDPVTEEFGYLGFENVTHLFSDDRLYLFRTATKLRYDNNRVFCLKSNKTYEKSTEFRVKKGVEPSVAFRPVNAVEFVEDVWAFVR